MYPSILKDLLINAINFAISITPTDNKIIRTILHARKSLLFNKNEIWVKKDNPDFDITMNSFGRAEVCELVRLYLLDFLRKDNKIGLYIDGGLSYFQSLSGPESEKTNKKICKIFKQHGLNITMECNLPWCPHTSEPPPPPTPLSPTWANLHNPPQEMPACDL